MSLLLDGESEESVRSELLKKQYSIVEIHEASQLEGTCFHFEARELGGSIKSGQLQSEDILSAYTKLVDDLEYDIVKLYPEWANPDKQDETLAKVKKLYELSRKWSSKINTLKKKKDVLSKKKVVHMQEHLVTLQKLYDEVLDVARDEQKDTSKIQHFSSEIKVLRNMSNISKIYDFMEMLLEEMGSFILDNLSAHQKAKSWIQTMNKVSKKIGYNKKFSLNVKKDIFDTVFFTQIQKGVQVLGAKNNKKKNLYDTLRNERARKKYTQELFLVLRSTFLKNPHEALLRIQVISERLSEVSPYRLHVGVMVDAIRVVFLSLMVGVVVFSVFIASGFVYTGVKYSSFFVFSILSLFLFLFFVKTSRIWFVVCLMISILLGIMIPNF